MGVASAIVILIVGIFIGYFISQIYNFGSLNSLTQSVLTQSVNSGLTNLQVNNTALDKCTSQINGMLNIDKAKLGSLGNASIVNTTTFSSGESAQVSSWINQWLTGGFSGEIYPARLDVAKVNATGGIGEVARIQINPEPGASPLLAGGAIYVYPVLCNSSGYLLNNSKNLLNNSSEI